MKEKTKDEHDKKKNIEELYCQLFDFSSHKRASEAIEFGLHMREDNFHVFVLGEDLSHANNGTISYLRSHVKPLKKNFDWVYVNNFQKQYKPLPFSLPAGEGCTLSNEIKSLLTDLVLVFNKAIKSPIYLKKIDDIKYKLQKVWHKNLSTLYQEAEKNNCQIIEHPESGFRVECQEEGSVEISHHVQRQLNFCLANGQIANQKAHKKIVNLKKQFSEKAMNSLFNKFQRKWKPFLKDWLDDLKKDILENLDRFVEIALYKENNEEENETKIMDELISRYSVNILVNQSNQHNSRVCVELYPTYDRLFGSIKYENTANGIEPNFKLIRPGSLHTANGGILVLLADELVQNPDVWPALKRALRDKKIRIEERFRDNMPPLADAPQPYAIPLDIQIFLLTSHHLYYNFFAQDPEFREHFKIKAEIEPDMPTSEKNLTIYKKLIQQASSIHSNKPVDECALSALLKQGSRWAEHTGKISSRFEQAKDLLIEASYFARKSKQISQEHIEQALSERRQRNSLHAERHINHIHEGHVIIKTDGEEVGKTNALTVLTAGDHKYGLPCRVTAQVYPGSDGVINIERLTEMGGAIQQKGVFILEAFLKSTFRSGGKLSATCSVTFEQNYVDIDGDSASAAELVTILSSLSDTPIKQYVAITGSVNQWGEIQSVGGVHSKVEGFFNLCQLNKLNHKQGVIIPYVNQANLTLKPHIQEAITNKKFHIWPVKHIEEVIPILTNRTWDDVVSSAKEKIALFSEQLKNNNS